jgi:hypothetical protein
MRVFANSGNKKGPSRAWVKRQMREIGAYLRPVSSAEVTIRIVRKIESPIVWSI